MAGRKFFSRGPMIIPSIRRGMRQSGERFPDRKRTFLIDRRRTRRRYDRDASGAAKRQSRAIARRTEKEKFND
jgi:hypothetical protein